ncbi:glycine betaine ABC transporter substrate-binding protein [Haloechinothrix halophila]|uniref:glycine betaine ABC transporter substrate-binding protein n=1 Tax=Haloechinothrix halophila TaxID=1069073 RepID=UPI000556E3DE|nr:glycine betaine ABC transporter substrate-binding protein [Haloechinothrix halophila]
MRKSSELVSIVTAGALLLTGCGLGDSPPSNVSAGSLAESGNLAGVEVTVGGKEFTEQLILCEITAQALESAGAEVQRTCGMSGTSTVRSALVSGDIDMYWEYTGTGWITHLGKTKPIADPQELYQAVADKDEQQNSISWLDPAPADNTYAVAASREKAEELGVETLSDYAELATSDPAAAGFCGAAEFFGRDDGWPGLQDAYGFELKDAHVSELAAGAIYNSIDKGKPCAFGEVFATDGRIAALDLVVLTDDKDFFTAYNPAVAIRKDALAANPAISDVLAPLADSLTDETLQTLNAEVDVDGATPEKTAKDWLVEEGFVGE